MKVNFNDNENHITLRLFGHFSISESLAQLKFVHFRATAAECSVENLCRDSHRSIQDGFVRLVHADALRGRVAAGVGQLVDVSLAPRRGLPVGVVRQSTTLELEKNFTNFTTLMVSRLKNFTKTFLLPSINQAI